MLKTKEIECLKSGEIPKTIASDPFIVMREKVGLRRSDNNGWRWSISTSPAEKDMTVISREDALQIIKEHSMNVTYSRPYGQIYETEGEPFRKTYSNQ